MTKIVAISDLHGHLPEIPECGLLLIAGDVCPATNHNVHYQAYWLEANFKEWLLHVSAKHVIGIAGNHDFIFQNRPELVPKLPWIYLQDTSVEALGLKIYGTPWQPVFNDWAFNLPEPKLAEKWALIPQGIDILLVHGPPLGYGDLIPRKISDDNEEEWPEGVHVGSSSLLKRIEEIKPRLAVYGHIHGGHGRYQIDRTVLINASLLDDRYNVINKPFVIELVDGKFLSIAP